MGVKLTRDHHLFTRDTITSNNTSTLNIVAQDNVALKVGASDGGVIVSAFKVTDGNGNNIAAEEAYGVNHRTEVVKELLDKYGAYIDKIEHED